MTATGSTGQPFTGNQGIDALFSLSKWNTTTIDYNFPTSATYYAPTYGGANNEPAGFVAVSEAFKTMVRAALTQFEAVSNLDFTEVAANAASNVSVGRTSQLGSFNGHQFNGYGYYPGSLARAGDVWFSNSTSDVADTYPFSLGRNTFALVLHELGHAMGLKHPHETSGGNSLLMPASLDFGDFSVMSYRRYENGPTSGNTSEAFGRPQTLMMYDILALQTMYGANYTHNSGDTTYVWSTTTGQMFVNGVGGDVPGGGGAGANRIFMTLWDGGGIDTYSFSNYTTALTINLNPGAGSILSTAQLAIVSSPTTIRATANVFNAFLFNDDERSLIENVIGGTNADHITGNAANNALTGGLGNDALDGGAGIDTARFDVLSTAATWVRNGDVWTVNSANGIDVLTGIERLQFLDVTVALPDPASDFNGDGTSDILWYSQSLQAVGMFQMDDGAPTWVGIGAANPGWGISSVTGDFNGDGTTDILFHNPSVGAVGMFQMDDGVPTWAGIGAISAGWVIAAAGDFNGDSTDDILWYSQSFGAAGMFLMDDGVPTWTGFGAINPGWGIEGAGDFNGDGTDDLLLHNPTVGAVGMFQMDDGVPTWVGIGPVSAGWDVAGIGDFNGDGTDDILWYNASLGAVGLFQMDDGAPTWAGVGAINPGWSLATIGDYNGDGTDDILLYNSSAGAVGMFQMNDGVATWAGIGPISPGWDWV